MCVHVPTHTHIFVHTGRNFPFGNGMFTYVRYVDVGMSMLQIFLVPLLLPQVYFLLLLFRYRLSCTATFDNSIQ